MNKTLIAAAVSTALMAPVAAQADATLYGRIHQGIQLTSSEGGESTTDFIGIGSRFGIKASSDLGNGMTASAHYEFGTTSDRNNHGSNAVSNADPVDGSLWSADSSGITNRIATVGLSGAFGSINLGNQWSAWYNKVGVHVDPTFWVGGSHHIGPFRTANTIKYSNSFGPVSFEVDARLDDTDAKGKLDPDDPLAQIPDGKGDEGGDGFALAASIAVSDNITLAAGIDNTTDGADLSGAAIQVSLGNYWASIAQQSSKPDGGGAEPSVTQLWAGGSFGDTAVMLGTGRADDDAGGNPSDVTLGVYHDMGGGFKLLYEGNKEDSDGAGSDKTIHLFGVRLDF